MPRFSGGTAYIDVPGGFSLAATFECGQAFRWTAAGPDAYEGVAGCHWARISRTDDGIAVTPCDEAMFEGFWRHYLDLDGDYCAWECDLALDAAISPMVACCSGMRLLNQGVWECLICFLLSSNNNVKRISGIVERLCSRFGRDMGGYHAFPTPEQFARAGESGIRGCGAGYRAAYLARAADAVLDGFDLEGLAHIGCEAARERLLLLHGVGEKVADCVLLFSCGYREAFPVDVWVRRAMGEYFRCGGQTPGEIRRFAAERFGRLAGLAQQYLFHYERVLKSGKQSSGDTVL